VPSEYAGFGVVVFSDEAVGPNAYGSLAVKLRWDDIEGAISTNGCARRASTLAAT
jgi:hypothetical protein